MAIKVSSTAVIDDSRILQNLAGASGSYTSFYPTITAISSAINMAKPVMSCTLSSNVTFTTSNRDQGRNSVLVLDTNTSSFTPTFPAEITWANDTTPTWSDNRYWHIAMWCWNNTDIRAAAVGYNS